MKSNELEKFIEEIKYVNRNPKNNSVLQLLESQGKNPEIILEKDSQLFRSRIISDGDKINEEKGFFGYGSKGSFIPPRERAVDMRANYRYIPYLYCSNHRYISIAEVRPWLAAEVSVATISVQEKLTLLDFSMQEDIKQITTAKKICLRTCLNCFQSL